MWAPWLICVGGFSAGVGGLYLRDVLTDRYRRGEPVVPGLIWKPILCLTVFVVFMAGTIIPSMSCCRHSARRIVSKSNLAQLGKAMAMYADVPGNNSLYPQGGKTPTESLWMLYGDFVDDHRVYWNPRSKAGALSGKPIIRKDKSVFRVPVEYLAATGYVYLEGYGREDSSQIVAYEKIAIDDGRSVLLASGAVEWMDEADFQEKMAGQFKTAFKSRTSVTNVTKAEDN